LFFHLQQQQIFSEDTAKFLCGEILLALEYLHSNGIIYRDLKPENLLINKEGHIIMTDFGLSKEGLNDPNDRTGTFCGTPEYLAPEILEGKTYGKGVDWWSFGSLLYEMLTGLPPFYDEDLQKMYTKIMTEEITYPNTLSENAIDILKKLLERDGEKRLNDPAHMKQHPFFATIDFDRLVKKELTPPFIPPTKDDEDIQNIDEMFTNEDIDAEEEVQVPVPEESQGNFEGFTYMGKKKEKV